MSPRRDPPPPREQSVKPREQSVNVTTAIPGPLSVVSGRDTVTPMLAPGLSSFNEARRTISPAAATPR